MGKYWLLVVFLLLSLWGCSKKEAPAEEKYSLDHVVNTKLPPPSHFLHKRFTVHQYENFEFEVPAHALTPHLQGTFNTYHGSGSGSDDAANIDLYLLDDGQYKDFLRGTEGGAVRTAKSSSEHAVNWVLASTFEEPRKYHLVFNNDSTAKSTKYVNADFTVSFE